MPTRKADAQWEGSLTDGKGTMRFGSGAFEGAYSFSSRFEEGTGTNPEELIAAAHAGCFSMAFASSLTKAGHVPDSVQTTANVHLDKGDAGFSITRIDLISEVKVSGIDDAKFQELAEATKSGCPVSRALASVDITLKATLSS
ncbi:MAG: lipoyl-dependent peroxiredoxin [Actinomycetota bacterium]|jgi:osmotically inducible protein OsmC|nr:lipoyl-dependent peroxiredoxin [Actinomycetota bacterium]